MERFDLLHSIHKALRHAMLTFDIDSGRTDFSDPAAVEALSASWSQLRENLGHHAEHEDQIMFALLRERAPGEPRDPYGWGGEVDGLHEDHVRIHQIERSWRGCCGEPPKRSSRPPAGSWAVSSTGPFSATPRCASSTSTTRSAVS